MSQNLSLFTLNRDVNPNAQFSVGNAVAFADAAGTAPVDGTGGAPTVTITRTESTPLDGPASFLFTKDAANRQGQGWSFDIVLQPSDATKPFTLAFDYQITTGTYTGFQALPSFSDLTVWFYDVTNAVMYQATPFQVDGSVSSTNQYSFQAQWQVPVGCLSARIIWFLGNTGASAFTAKFNNISFGRTPRIQGSIETPWTSFTPTGSWTANSTYTGSWRRVGDTVEVQTKIALAGAPTSANLTINLPPGLTIDPAKLTSASNGDAALGYGIILDTGTTRYYAVVAYSSSTAVSVRASTLPGTYLVTNTTVSETIPMTFASGDQVDVFYRVPILGWGANGTLGQDADSRVVSCKYSMGTSYVFPKTTAVPFQFNTREWDTFGAATFGSGVTFTYYIPVAGLYQYTLNMFSDNQQGVGAGGDWYRLFAFKNGTTFSTSCFGLFVAPTAGFTGKIAGSNTGYGQFVAGDAITFTAQTDGPSYLVLASTVFNHLSITRMSGPAQVQAPEIITARYSTNAGQSITNNSVTIIDYEDKSYDDHGCVTTGASWKFTAPRAGKVKVNAEATLASNAGWGIGETAYLSVFKNAVEFGRGPYDAPATATLVVDLSVNDQVDVLAGDTIDIRIFQLSGGTIALDTTSVKNYVAISYVGGIG